MDEGGMGGWREAKLTVLPPRESHGERREARLSVRYQKGLVARGAAIHRLKLDWPVSERFLDNLLIGEIWNAME